MNKSVKLPLFLGAVCLIAGASLAVVNAITQPIIEQRERDAKAQGYLSVLGLSSASGYYFADPVEATGDLKTKGVETYVKVLVGNESGALFGMVYDVTTSGWDSGLKFQIGVKEGFFSGYNNISNNETPGIGKDFIEGKGAYKGLNEYIKNLSATDANAIEAKFADISSTGTSAHVTSGAISAVLVAISVHYNSELGA